MKLKSGSVNRKPTPIEIDGATFHIRPLSGELYTSFTLYISEYTDSMLSLRDKRTFIKTHIVDWENLIVINKNEKEEEIEFTISAATELLLDPDADDVITFLYSEALRLRQDIDEKKKEDEPKAKK
jgi:hypothetical protein